MSHAPRYLCTCPECQRHRPPAKDPRTLDIFRQPRDPQEEEAPQVRDGTPAQQFTLL